MSRELMKAKREKLTAELLAILNTTIDDLVTEAIAERVKEYDTSYVYDWYKPEIYELPEFKNYPRERLPNIIRVETIDVAGYPMEERRRSIQNSKNNGGFFHAHYASYTQKKHLEETLERSRSNSYGDFPPFFHKTKLYITLEGQYFFEWNLEEDPQGTFDAVMQHKLPVSKKIYDEIVTMEQDKLEELFKYRGDIKSNIAHWTNIPAIDVGLQLLKAEQIKQEAKEVFAASDKKYTDALEIREKFEDDREVFEEERAAEQERREMHVRQMKEQQELAACEREKLVRQAALIERRRADVLDQYAKVAEVKNLQHISSRLHDLLLETELLVGDRADEIGELIKLCRPLAGSTGVSDTPSASPSASATATAIPITPDDQTPTTESSPIVDLMPEKDKQPSGHSSKKK